MAWDDARARREEYARAKAAREAGEPDAQATEPLPAAVPAERGERWWTVRPVARHGWKVASALAALAILLSAAALLTDRGDHTGAGDRDGGRVGQSVQIDDHAPPGGWGEGRGGWDGGGRRR